MLNPILSSSSALGLVFASTQALAQAGAPAAAGQPPAYLTYLPMLVLFAVFYFLVMRPQANKQKEHQKFLSQLKRGDEIVTASGILGRIEGLTDLFITLEIAPNVRIKVLRGQVASPVPTAAAVVGEAKT